MQEPRQEPRGRGVPNARELAARRAATQGGGRARDGVAGWTPYFVLFFVLAIGPMRPVLWSVAKAALRPVGRADSEDLRNADLPRYDGE